MVLREHPFNLKGGGGLWVFSDIQINFLKELLDENLNACYFSCMLEEKIKIKEMLVKEEMKGLMIRSKAKWIKEGEKPTKYFLNLEKRNYVNKTITKLVNKKGLEVIEQDQILNECKSFYKNLYSSRDHELEDVDLDSLVGKYSPKLDDDDTDICEISLKEAYYVLYKMKNSKSPGTTGFTADFFKFFWKDLGYPLIRSLNYSLAVNELSISQKNKAL